MVCPRPLSVIFIASLLHNYVVEMDGSFSFSLHITTAMQLLSKETSSNGVLPTSQIALCSASYFFYATTVLTFAFSASRRIE